MGNYWHTGKSFLLVALFAGIAYFGISQFVQHNTAFAYSNDPLERLMEGNQRFCNFHPVHPDEDISRLKKVQEGQHPIAVVICCSDSRLSPELIFDQGMGDLFVIRTAGNIIGGVELGSVEYAVEHLGVNLVMVMGHESCGAIKALVEGGDVHGHIQDIIDSLKQESEIRELVSREGYHLEHCIRANIIHGVRQINNQSALVRDKVAKGQLKLIGTRFDLNSLKVDTISTND